MKATGVVRRIDELGRIVIPKEIRKTMRIREGENIEIYIDSNENIVLKKYSIMKKLGDFAQSFTDSIHSFLKHNIIITDSDSIIAISGDLKKATQNQLNVIDLANSLFCEVNPIPVKAALNLLGYNYGIPRLPLIPLSDAGKQKLEKAMKEFGTIS